MSRPRPPRKLPREIHFAPNWWRPPKPAPPFLLQGVAQLPLCPFPLTLTKRAKGLPLPPPQSLLWLLAFSCLCSKRGQPHMRGWGFNLPYSSPSDHLKITLFLGAWSTSSSGEDEVPLVDKDTKDKIETSFVALAKRHVFLLQGNCSKAHGGCCYGSFLACGCVGLKPAGWPVTSQAQAMQGRKLNDSCLSSNSSWTDNDSDSKEDTKEIDSTNNEGNKGHVTASNKTLTPVCPITLFSDNRNSVTCLMERSKASILNGIWSGAHNISLLTCFVGATSQVTGLAIVLLHNWRTLNCWKTLPPLSNWTTGILLNLTARILLLFPPCY